MKIALAQMNSLTGEISFNEKKILSYIAQTKKQKASLLIFPEMALTGYPPLDLMKRKFFLKKTIQTVKNIHKQIPEGMAVLLGTTGPGFPPGNSVCLLQKNQKIKFFSKEYLADYDVFDEQRYFKKGRLQDNFFRLGDTEIQILICEEIWREPVSIFTTSLKKKRLIISLNASPFELNKNQARRQRAKKWIKKYQCPFIYINAVGGQEELIFDGGSFILSPTGHGWHQSPFFKEDLSFFSLPEKNQKQPTPVRRRKNVSKWEKISEGLIFGLKEFMEKNYFSRAHLGLSGGVDSALTAALACKALGEKKIQLLFLPGPFTSRVSEKYAHKTAHWLKCPLIVQSIQEVYSFLLKDESFHFKKNKVSADLTRQNIQARLRNLLLMAYANRHPESLLLGTSNKSELSLGYSTLYGDLSGGILPLGDLFKTEVYELASYMKIPASVIRRKATAELKKNQKDEDDLPPYKILDPVLQKLIEQERDPQGAFEKKILNWIIKSEFKRRQSPPVLKIKNRSFDKGWRLPLSISLNMEQKIRTDQSNKEN